MCSFFPFTHTHTHIAITLRIYTCLEGQVESIQFPTGRYTTAGDIVTAMVKRLGLPEETKDVFSVWLVSPYLRKYMYMYMYLLTTVGLEIFSVKNFQWFAE